MCHKKFRSRPAIEFFLPLCGQNHGGYSKRYWFERENCSLCHNKFTNGVWTICSTRTSVSKRPKWRGLWSYFRSIYDWYSARICRHAVCPCGHCTGKKITQYIKAGRYIFTSRILIFNEHDTIYVISSDFGDCMTTQSMGLTSLLSGSF